MIGRVRIRRISHALGNSSATFFSLITAPMVARALGVENRGLAAIFLTASSLFVTGSGLGLAWQARESLTAGTSSITTLRVTSRRVSLALTPFAITLAVGLWRKYPANSHTLLALICLFVLSAFVAVRGVDASVLQSTGRGFRIGRANLVLSACTSLSILVLYAFHCLELSTLILSNAIGLAAQMFMLWRYTRSNLLDEKVRLRVPTPTWHESMTHIKSALPAWRAQVLDAAACRADLILVTSIATSNLRAIGLYSIASLIPQVCYSISQTVIQTGYSEKPEWDSETRWERSVQASLILSVGLATAAAVGALWLVPNLLGPGFAGVRFYLIPAVLTSGALALLAPTLVYLAKSGKQLAPLLLVVVPWGIGFMFGSLHSPITALYAFSLSAVGLVFAYITYAIGPRVWHVNFHHLLMQIFGDRKSK